MRGRGSGEQGRVWLPRLRVRWRRRSHRGQTPDRSRRDIGRPAPPQEPVGDHGPGILVHPDQVAVHPGARRAAGQMAVQVVAAPGVVRPHRRLDEAPEPLTGLLATTLQMGPRPRLAQGAPRRLPERGDGVRRQPREGGHRRVGILVHHAVPQHITGARREAEESTEHGRTLPRPPASGLAIRGDRAGPRLPSPLSHPRATLPP